MSRALEALVRAHGDGDLIAAATLQPGLARFETSYGVIPYRSAWGHDVTLGGPLCAPADRPALLDAFLRARRRPVFCYLRADVARQLAGRGLHLAGMGVDRHADPVALTRATPRPVRGALKKARKAGLTLDEVALQRLGPRAREALQRVNARYLARAECTVEMTFLNAPMRYEPDGLRRLFLLRERGALLGFAVLAPIFRRRRVVAYLLDLLRFGPTRVWGVWLSTVHRLAARLADEGVGLSLGFAPLHRVSHPPARSPGLARGIDRMAGLLASAPYLERLRTLKDTIPGADEPRYFASPCGSALWNLLLLMEVSSVGARYLLGPDLARVLSRGARGVRSSDGARSGRDAARAEAGR